jgi:predicted dehydrogenase
VRAVAERHGLESRTTSLEEALDDPAAEIYFDAQITPARVDAVRAAVATGKHVYTETPVAVRVDALELVRLAHAAGIKHGVTASRCSQRQRRPAPWSRTPRPPACGSASNRSTRCSARTAR